MSAVVAGIVPYLEQRSVPLLLLSREEREHPELFSGTLVTVGGRHFICTAAHCIKGADIGQIVPVVSKRLTGERVLLLGHGYRGGGDHDDLDIGWIEVDQRHPDLAAYHFVPVGQIVRGVSEIRGDMAVLSGCPQETVPRDLALRGHYQLRAMHYVTVTKAMAEWPATCRPENDIVLDYPDHDNVLPPVGKVSRDRRPGQRGSLLARHGRRSARRSFGRDDPYAATDKWHVHVRGGRGLFGALTTLFERDWAGLQPGPLARV